MTVTQDQVLAYAVYEIRLLLADHLGNGDAPDPAVRAAAHLAYALHNQADAVLHGDTFDPLLAAEALSSVDRMLATNFQSSLLETTSHEA